MKSDVNVRARRAWRRLLCLGLIGVAGVAAATENITYGYDAQGRLVKVAHSGTINSNTSACYSYDRADNRINLTASTTSDCAAATPAVSFSANDVAVREGSGNLVFTVTKTGTASGSLTIDYATSDGSATAGSDYTAASGTLTFLASDTSKAVTVTVADDTIVEPDETLTLNLSNPGSGSTVGDGQGIGTINDNDSDCAGVTFTVVSNGAVTEGANSSFTMTKTGSTSYSCNVSYATANGSAILGSDYAQSSGTLTFTSGQATQIVNVPTINDATFEAAESFTLNLSAPDKNGTIGSPGIATATINDNDACSGINFTIANSGAVTEGSNSIFTITKSSVSSGPCSVSYATSDGSAVAPGDYTATSGTVTFTAPQTSQIVNVPTITDALSEGAESFSMSLSNPTDSSVLGSPSSASATINDSGGVCSGVSYSVNDVTVTEGSPLVFTVTKTGSTSSSCSINYATANGTAVAPTQYTAKSGTLTFTSGQTSQTVSVTTINLNRLNGNKTMFLNLSGATGGASISDSQGLGTIRPSG